MCNQSRTCNNTQIKNNRMCVTYVGISTRLTNILYALSETLYTDFNSYVENVMRARCAHLKSPKHVEST